EVDHGPQEGADRASVGECTQALQVVEAGKDQPDQRIDDPVCEGGDHVGEGDAHDEGDGQFDDVPPADEVAKFPDHGVPSCVCTTPTTPNYQAIGPLSLHSWRMSGRFSKPWTSSWAMLSTWWWL